MKKFSDYLETNEIVYDRSNLEGYSSDASFLTLGVPEVIVFPVDEEEVLKIVDYASRENINLVPRGTGSGTAGACLAPAGSVLIDTERLGVCNRWGQRPYRLPFKCVNEKGDIVNLRKVSKDSEVYVRVGSGATSDEINKVISKLGWTVAVVPSSGYSTLGGNFSTNARGPGTPSFGAFGDTVNRLRMVVATDTAAKAIVVRDREEIKKLAGNHGLFGLITELDVKIVPLSDPIRSLCAVIIIERKSLPEAASIMGDIMFEVGKSCVFQTGEFLFVDEGIEGEGSGLAQNQTIESFLRFNPERKKFILMYRGKREELGSIKSIVAAVKETNYHEVSPDHFECLLEIRKKATGRSPGRVAVPGFEDIMVRNPLKLGDVLGKMVATIGKKFPGRPIGHHYRDGVVIHYRPQARSFKKELQGAWDLTQKLRSEILKPEFEVEMRKEHGLGLELMKLSSPERTEEILRLKKKHDPRNIFNRHLLQGETFAQFIGSLFRL